MASSVGRIGPFNPEHEDWTLYSERVDFYFIANGITGADKKRATFLSLIGADTYKTLRSLIVPAAPTDMSYEELKKKLEDHFAPKRSQIYYRSEFYRCQRKQNMSVAEYMSQLRSLAKDCGFGGQLDVMLRDRLICGINDVAIQKRLLSEGDDLTLKDALQHATSLELAIKDSKELHPSGSDTVHSTRAGGRHQKPHYSNSQHHTAGGSVKRSCYRCGQSGHTPDKCRYKNATCFNCNKTGHISSVCRSNPRRSTPSRPSNSKMADRPVHDIHSTDTLDEYSFTVRTGRTNPIIVDVVIDDVSVKMELDTGSSVSIMSLETFRLHFPFKVLEESSTRLRTYSGELLTVQGIVHVNVVYKKQNVVLPLHIVSENGPTLFGREWLYEIKLDWHAVHSIKGRESVDLLLHNYESLFTNELGQLKNFKAHIYVDPQVTPKFYKPRPIPYAYRKKVEDELQRLSDLGIISPIQFSEWAAPIVPVLKSDKVNVRICGDYSVTVNKASKLESYPIPKLDDLLAALSGGTVYTKLDMSQAYQQLELDEDSKRFTVINTHKGLFTYNRLPFGISSAPAIFQRVMESLLQDIPNVAVYIDDILVAGKSHAEHIHTLEKVFSRLHDAGLQLKKEKCTFCTSSVQYLGFRIDKEGIHPTAEKIRAIKEAPTPKNITQLKAYLGLLSYYNRFLPHLPSTVAPLYELLHHDITWHWSAEAEAAFIKSKELLTDDKCLVHFDSTLPLLLACDASQYGVGAVLAHRFPDGTERPIAFASRTLSNTEKKYSQVEKEGLACVFGVRKFHCYLYGQHFSLITDHKPLLSLLSGQKPISSQSSARIQRWALILAAYEYDLHFKSSTNHANADALSRLPLNESISNTPLPPELILLMESIANSPVTAKSIATGTKADSTLSLVLQYLKSGWPDSCPDESLKPYWHRQHELSLHDGCILWASRVVIPEKFRQQLLLELHEGHFGITKLKARARSCIWWPNIDTAIEQMVKSCSSCQENRNSPPEAPIHPWPWPSRPWSRLHIDFAGPLKNNTMLLIIIDAFSKWIEVFPMTTVTSSATISKLKVLFAQFGLPDTIVSDNGPSLVSKEFESYLTQHGIRHITSSPYHPASNGLAERAVQLVKNGLKKDTDGTLSERLARILLNYRVIPHNTTGVSPSELMFGRIIKSKVDLVKPDLTTRVENNQYKQKDFHDQHSHSRKFLIGEGIMYRNFNGDPKWKSGRITKYLGSLSFLIQGDDGTNMRRHIDHIIKRKQESIVLPDDLTPFPITRRTTEETRNTRSPYPTRFRRPPNWYAPFIS